MEIRVNTDSHITGSQDMNEKYSAELKKKLNRFSEYITSVEVFFADENRGKFGIDDKRCTIEVRPKNMSNEAVSYNAGTLEHAFNGAIDKMKKLMDTRVGKMQSR